MNCEQCKADKKQLVVIKEKTDEGNVIYKRYCNACKDIRLLSNDDFVRETHMSVTFNIDDQLVSFPLRSSSKITKQTLRQRVFSSRSFLRGMTL